jgi:hypothetical protein
MQEKGSQLAWGWTKNLAAVHARTHAGTAAAIVLAASAGGSRLHQVVGRCHHPVEVPPSDLHLWMARFFGLKLWMLLKNGKTETQRQTVNARSTPGKAVYMLQASGLTS